jgi:hypothetical protein
MRRGGFAGAIFAFLYVLLLCGCNNARMAEVSGTITLDDVPIKTGAITFTPVDGQSTTQGSQISDGQYSANVPVTVMKVSISSPKVVGTKKLYPRPDSPEMPLTEEALPAKYNERSELQLDVQPGRNKKDFHLSSK